MATEPPSSPHIVVVHSSDEMYGADRILLEVLAALSELDGDIEVWLPSDVPHGRYPLCRQLDELGYRYSHRELPILRRAMLRPTGLPRLLRRVWVTARMLRRERPDLVYLASSACLLVAPIARLVGVRRRVLHIQERWTGRSSSILRELARATTSRIAISGYVAEMARLRKPQPVVVPNAVEDASRRAGLHPIEVADRELRFVVASRWNRWKGHRTLLQAWAIAGCPGRLTVLGGPPPGGTSVDVPGLVANLPRPETVEIVGEVADIAPFLVDADVLVLPSDDPEPFGLVVIEAFSLARPAIVSRAGGPLEVVIDGGDGWFFEPGDASSLADVLGRLDVVEVADAGRRARATFETRYGVDRYRQSIRSVVAAEFAGAPT